MSTAIGGSGFEVVDLTTLAEVKLLMGGAYADTASDPLITSMISTISEEITRYLGFHTLSAARTDVYYMRQGKRILTLDARPVSALTSLKLAVHPDDLATATELVTSAYVLHNASGWLRFTGRQAVGDYYAQAAYTGGLGAATANVLADHKQIAYACGLQVKYAMQRRDTPGGNITSLAGGATTFDGQYTLLREVRSILDALRRGNV